MYDTTTIKNTILNENSVSAYSTNILSIFYIAIKVIYFTIIIYLT